MVKLTPTRKHKICIVDADIESRQRLVKTFAADPRFEVFGYGASESFLTDIKFLSPDGIILDLEMPRIDDQAQGCQLMQTQSDIPTIVLTTCKTTEPDLNGAAMNVRDIFAKPCKPELLVETALRYCKNDSAFASSNKISTEISYEIQNWAFIARFFGLSKRQREIAQRICQSMSAESIANDLNISSNTVRMHIKVLYEKLSVKDRVGVAMRCVGADTLVGTSR